MIRDMIVSAFDRDAVSETTRGLYDAFTATLLPDLDEGEFADMFAQTLAYGLFAARVNHPGPEPFQRIGAAREIPKTNPFLRRLFDAAQRRAERMALRQRKAVLKTDNWLDEFLGFAGRE